ncbi:MAG: hypothetical protein WAV09_04075 [Minisyncoccia bacterium]
MIEIWTMDKADAMFSKWIRARDGRCMYPGCKRKYDTDVVHMQNSHFYSRAEWATRYDPENCDTAHPGCHMFHWEGTKNTGYMQFKKEQLGTRRFNAMKKRVDDSKKFGAYTSHRDRIFQCMEFLRKEKFVDENYKLIKQ